MSTETEPIAALDLGPLHIAIGSLSDEVKELRKRLAFMQDDLEIAGSVICPNPSATFSIDLGSPSAGKWWQVRSLVVGGSDITSTPTGVAWIVVASDVQLAGLVPMTKVRDFTKNALPQNAFYGAHELPVNFQQHLWVIVTGGTAGQQYSAGGIVENFPQFVRSSL